MILLHVTKRLFASQWLTDDRLPMMSLQTNSGSVLILWQMKVKSYSVATICASNRTVSPLTCLLSSNCAHIESKIFNANLSQLLEKKESNHSEAKGFECMLKPKCEYFLLLGYFCDDCSFSLLKHWLTFFTQPFQALVDLLYPTC